MKLIRNYIEYKDSPERNYSSNPGLDEWQLMVVLSDTGPIIARPSFTARPSASCQKFSDRAIFFEGRLCTVLTTFSDFPPRSEMWRVDRLQEYLFKVDFEIFPNFKQILSK